MTDTQLVRCNSLLPTSLVEQLRRLSFEQKISISKLVRLALVDFISRQDLREYVAQNRRNTL